MRPKPRGGLVVVPPDKGRKSSHLIFVEHTGGGWYSATCMGEARKCREGECNHVNGLRMRGPSGSARRVRPQPRETPNGVEPYSSAVALNSPAPTSRESSEQPPKYATSQPHRNDVAI